MGGQVRRAQGPGEENERWSRFDDRRVKQAGRQENPWQFVQYFPTFCLFINPSFKAAFTPKAKQCKFLTSAARCKCRDWNKFTHLFFVPFHSMWFLWGCNADITCINWPKVCRLLNPKLANLMQHILRITFKRILKCVAMTAFIRFWKLKILAQSEHTDSS